MNGDNTRRHGEQSWRRACWPRRAEIWEKLTLEPLAPETVMRERQLAGKGFCCPSGRQTLTTSLPSGCSAAVATASCAAPASLLDRYRSASALWIAPRVPSHTSVCVISQRAFDSSNSASKVPRTGT